MISKKEIYEERLDLCFRAIVWNEVILEVQIENKESQEKIDATKHAIEIDKNTIERLKIKLSNDAIDNA